MMSDQGDLFGGRGERDKAFKSVGRGTWISRALAVIRDDVFGEFTGEELRIELLRLGLEPPHHHNAWGALIYSAIRHKILMKTGRNAQMRIKRSHARSTPILRKL